MRVIRACCCCFSIDCCASATTSGPRAKESFRARGRKRIRARAKLYARDAYIYAPATTRGLLLFLKSLALMTPSRVHFFMDVSLSLSLLSSPRSSLYEDELERQFRNGKLPAARLRATDFVRARACRLFLQPRVQCSACYLGALNALKNRYFPYEIV